MKKKKRIQHSSSRHSPKHGVHKDHQAIYRYFRKQGIVVFTGLLGIMFLSVLHSGITGAAVTDLGQQPGIISSLWLTIASIVFIIVALVGFFSQRS